MMMDTLLWALMAMAVFCQVWRGDATDAAFVAIVACLWAYKSYLDAKIYSVDMPKMVVDEIEALKSKLNNVTLAVGIKKIERKN